jgi:DNA uptake protein ComE-like DNA-binding protein
MARGLAGTIAPRAARRATLGVALVLLGLHGLAAGTGAKTGSPAIAREQARLRLDPNVASREELMLLPGVGPTLADYIIEYREALRPQRAFQCSADLDHVKRIGPVTVAGLRPLLRFPSASSEDIDAEASQP